MQGLEENVDKDRSVPAAKTQILSSHSENRGDRQDRHHAHARTVAIMQGPGRHRKRKVEIGRKEKGVQATCAWAEAAVDKCVPAKVQFVRFIRTSQESLRRKDKKE